MRFALPDSSNQRANEGAFHDIVPWILAIIVTVLAGGMAFFLLPYFASAYYLNQGASRLESALADQNLKVRDWEAILLTPLNLHANDLENQIEGSKRSLELAIQWDPTNAQAFSALADVHYIEHNLALAADAVRHFSELRPNNPLSRLQLGDIYDAMGKAEESVREYEQSGVDLSGTSIGERAAVNYLKLAEAYLVASDPNRALPVLRKVLAIDPDNLYALYHLAKIYETMGEEGVSLAQAHYRRLREIGIGDYGDMRLYAHLPDLIPQLVEEGVWHRERARAVISSLMSKPDLVPRLIKGSIWSRDDLATLVTMANASHPPTPAIMTETITSTLHIPVITKHHQPSWVSPLGTLTRDYQVLSRANQAGMNWLRVPISWRATEPSKGQYEWVVHDAKLLAVAEAGLTPIVLIGATPEWSTSGGRACDPPDDPGDLHDFLVEAVTRYKDPPYNVKYWQLYNEEDHLSTIQTELGCMGDRVEEYVEVLRVAYQTIKGIDPQARVVLGGMAMLGPPATNERFLTDVLEAGGGDYFDIAAFHFFASQINQTYTCADPDCTIRGLLGKASIVAQTLAQWGYDKPVMLTETSKRCLSAYPDEAPCSPEELERQADYVLILNARGMAAGLQAIIWYTLDYPGGYNSSLLDQNGAPKPAYYAYQTWNQELRQAVYLQRMDTPNSGCPEIEGHLFSIHGGTREKTVLWTNPVIDWTDSGEEIRCEVTTRLLHFSVEELPFGALRVVDKYGSERIVSDGDDDTGSIDGLVSLEITPSPIYVQAYYP